MLVWTWCAHIVVEIENSRQEEKRSVIFVDEKSVQGKTRGMFFAGNQCQQ